MKYLSGGQLLDITIPGATCSQVHFAATKARSLFSCEHNTKFVLAVRPWRDKIRKLCSDPFLAHSRGSIIIPRSCLPAPRWAVQQTAPCKQRQPLTRPLSRGHQRGCSHGCACRVKLQLKDINNKSKRTERGVLTGHMLGSGLTVRKMGCTAWAKPFRKREC